MQGVSEATVDRGGIFQGFVQLHESGGQLLDGVDAGCFASAKARKEALRVIVHKPCVAKDDIGCGWEHGRIRFQSERETWRRVDRDRWALLTTLAPGKRGGPLGEVL